MFNRYPFPPPVWSQEPGQCNMTKKCFLAQVVQHRPLNPLLKADKSSYSAMFPLSSISESKEQQKSTISEGRPWHALQQCFLLPPTGLPGGAPWVLGDPAFRLATLALPCNAEQVVFVNHPEANSYALIARECSAFNFGAVNSIKHCRNSKIITGCEEGKLTPR